MCKFAYSYKLLLCTPLAGGTSSPLLKQVLRPPTSSWEQPRAREHQRVVPGCRVAQVCSSLAPGEHR